jgi:hypothetical protein
VRVADDQLQLEVVRPLEGATAVQHVGDLAEEESELGPFDEQIVELDEPIPGGELALERAAVALEYRRSKPGMHPAVQLDELDLHVDRAGELRVGAAKSAQFGDFARLDPPGAGTLLVHGRFWPERVSSGKHPTRRATL